MIKKTLLKTLLPITSVALIGGGIASSLTLTSCSNKKVIIKSQKQAIEYLLKNAVILPSGKYEYVINETSNKKEIKESDAALFYNKILSAYNKQSYINSMVANACFRNIEGHSFFKIGGALAIENNKLEMDFENGSNLYSIVYDISEFEKINKYDLISIEYANGIPIGDPTSNYWDTSHAANVQCHIEEVPEDNLWFITLVNGELSSEPIPLSLIDLNDIEFYQD